MSEVFNVTGAAVNPQATISKSQFDVVPRVPLSAARGRRRRAKTGNQINYSVAG